MNIIFIGQIYFDGQLEYFKSKGSNIDVAAHTFQSVLLDGIKLHSHTVHIISTPYVSCYPKTKLLRIQGQDFSDGSGLKYSIPFLNISGIKHLTKIFYIRRKLKKLLSEGKEYRIIVYGIHSPFLLSLIGLNRHHRHKTCLVVPDLPEYMSEKGNPIYKIAKKIDRKFINIGLKDIDSYALFSNLMTERIAINKPYIVIEGIYKDDGNNSSTPKANNKIILYSGNLDARYGILMLIEAFSSINDNDFRLWICGNGNSIKQIQEYANNDNRITYWGVLPREKVLEMQRQATILVNPRKSSETYTRYSFPSKTMEYLASGTPTIMSHLASIPPEYDSHIYYIDQEDAEGLKKKIIEVASQSQDKLNDFGARAREFILTTKNSYKQAGKLLSLLETL